MPLTLSNPDMWADVRFANFLGRREEADAHNQPIRETREAERQAEYESRNHREEENRLQEQREYSAAIFDAEQHVLQKRELVDDDLRGTSLILQLFRENGITLPLKTQGWVKSSLHSIYHDDKYGWSYRYRGRESSVILDYVKQLVVKMDHKYEQAVEPDNTCQPEDDLEI